MTLPTLSVLLDDGTGSFPYDISKYAQVSPGYSFSRGRADWQGDVTAGVLNIQLDNSDGRFTDGSTKIASPSPIGVDQRIRVRETIGGSTFNEYTGYVKSWPVEWPATVTTIAMTAITATDAQARAERWRLLPTWAANEIVTVPPVAYWPLSDSSTIATAADLSGSAYTLRQSGSGTAVAFGSTVLPGVEASTAATFSALGKYLTGAPAFTLSATSMAMTVAFSTVSTGLTVLLSVGDGTSATDIRLNGGSLSIGSTFINSGYNDGQQHAVTVKYTSAATGVVYVDGVAQATGVSLPVAPVNAAAIIVGQVASGTDIVTIAHVAVWASATGINGLGISGSLNSFAGERTDQRAVRSAAYAGIATGSIDTGLTSLPASTIGQDDGAWAQLSVAVGAEMGAAYINGSGSLDFHSRGKVRLKTTPDLTLSATTYITPDVVPVVDDQQIINYFEGTSSTTGVMQVVRNTLSELGDGTATNPGHGRYPDSQTYLVATDSEVLDRGNWIIANFAEPTARYGTLTINLFKVANENPAMAAAILTAVDIDCWLRVTNMASQNPTGTTVDVVVQGFTKTRTANSWLLTCNVVLRSLYNALILNNATYGVLNSPVARLGI